MFSSNLHTPLVYEKDFLIPIEGEKIPEEVQKEIRSSHSHFSSFRNVFFTEPAIRGRTKRCMCTRQSRKNGSAKPWMLSSFRRRPCLFRSKTSASPFSGLSCWRRTTSEAWRNCQGSTCPTWRPCTLVWLRKFRKQSFNFGLQPSYFFQH